MTRADIAAQMRASLRDFSDSEFCACFFVHRSLPPFFTNRRRPLFSHFGRWGEKIAPAKLDGKVCPVLNADDSRVENLFISVLLGR